MWGGRGPQCRHRRLSEAVIYFASARQNKYLLQQNIIIIIMDRYELKEDLGNGSFGRVIKARHVDTGNIVSSRLYIYQSDFYIPGNLSWGGHSNSVCEYSTITLFSSSVGMCDVIGGNQTYEAQILFLGGDCTYSRGIKFAQHVPSKYCTYPRGDIREVRDTSAKHKNEERNSPILACSCLSSWILTYIPFYLLALHVLQT